MNETIAAHFHHHLKRTPSPMWSNYACGFRSRTLFQPVSHSHLFILVAIVVVVLVVHSSAVVVATFYNHVNLMSTVKQTHVAWNVHKIHKTHVLSVQLSLI